MSLWNSIMANTVGIVTRAATGVPDQWTQANQVEEETNNLLRAKGIDPSLATQEQVDAANAQATSDVTETIATFEPPAEIDCSNPQDFLTGLNCSLKKFENTIIIILIFGIVIYLTGKYLERGK